MRAEGAGVEVRFARSVRRWLVAYPPRWRRVRAGEITAVLADLAAPGATRLDVRSGLGLLRAGLATRRRMAPPFWVRMKYFGFDARVAPRYRPWVDDQIRSPLPGQGAGMVLLLVLFQWGLPYAIGTDPVFDSTFMVVYFLILGTITTSRGRAWQRRAGLRHLVPQPGEELVPGWYVTGLVFHPRLAARSGANLAAAFVGVTTVVAAAVLLVGRRPLPLLLGAFLLAGVPFALVGLLRWRHGIGRLPPQPARLVERADGPLRRCVASWMFVVVLVVVAAGVDAQWWVAYAVLGAAALVLPWVAAAWARTRGAMPDELALVDLRDLTVRRHPRVDEPVSGPVIWLPDRAQPAGGEPAPAPSGVAPA